MFSKVDALIINKIDVLPYCDFNLDACAERVRGLNPDIAIIPVSAKTGEGMERLADWIRGEVENM
jgi:hydrogenase nickel incorporation protein HypB